MERRGKGSQRPQSRDVVLPGQAFATVGCMPAPVYIVGVTGHPDVPTWPPGLVAAPGELPGKDPSGRVDLGSGEAEEGVQLSLGVAEEAVVSRVPAPRQTSSLPHFGRRGVKPKHPS